MAWKDISRNRGTAVDAPRVLRRALKARRPGVDESGREKMHDDNDHRIHHHVQLPGGRQIEVVYLESNRERDDGALQTPPPPRAGNDTRANSDTPVAQATRSDSSQTSAPGEALHVCPRCAGGLVSPLEWGEESPGRWHILMRCPDCDLVRDGVFGQALVERLDEELDRATGALLSDLKRLTHANMVEEIEVFSRALELDLIGPSDF
jgi:hypothetical protein